MGQREPLLLLLLLLGRLDLDLDLHLFVAALAGLGQGQQARVEGDCCFCRRSDRTALFSISSKRARRPTWQCSAVQRKCSVG